MTSREKKRRFMNSKNPVVVVLSEAKDLISSFAESARGEILQSSCKKQDSFRMTKGEGLRTSFGWRLRMTLRNSPARKREG
jgi:hypothetical protein